MQLSRKSNSATVLLFAVLVFLNSALGANTWTRNKNPDPAINSSAAQGDFNQLLGPNQFIAAGIAIKDTNGIGSLIRQSGFQNWTVGMMKDFRMTERQKLRFRAEGFNWINHPNWSAATQIPPSLCSARSVASLASVCCNLPCDIRFDMAGSRCERYAGEQENRCHQNIRC